MKTCVYLDLDFFGVHVLVQTDESQFKVYWFEIFPHFRFFFAVPAKTPNK